MKSVGLKRHCLGNNGTARPKRLSDQKNDIHDRRIQRLCLTEKCQPIIADGREMQTHFFTSVTAGLTDTELKLYQELSEKIRNQVIKLEKEL